MLQQSAIDAVRQWKFRPFMHDGSETAIVTEVTISFSLDISDEGRKAEKEFQATYWPNWRVAEEAMGKKDFVTAEKHFREAIRFAEKMQPRKHLELIMALTYLGHTYSQQRRYEEAEPLYGRALEIREQHQSPDEAEVGSAAGNLAMCYHALGQGQKAEPLYLQAIGVFEKRSVEEKPGVLRHYTRSLTHNLVRLGSLYQNQNRYHEALVQYKRALSLAEQPFDPEKPAGEKLLGEHDLALLKRNYEMTSRLAAPVK